jgi:hypothetical protein
MDELPTAVPAWHFSGGAELARPGLAPCQCAGDGGGAERCRRQADAEDLLCSWCRQGGCFSLRWDNGTVFSHCRLLDGCDGRSPGTISVRYVSGP